MGDIYDNNAPDNSEEFEKYLKEKQKLRKQLKKEYPAILRYLDLCDVD